MTNEDYVSISEMAALLKIPKSWLYSRSRETGPGSMPRLKVGKYIRLNPETTIAWIKERYGNTQG
ncbi:MAG: excisionase [Syntrophales bacterium]|jgi:hypothetical protein